MVHVATRQEQVQAVFAVELAERVGMLNRQVQGLEGGHADETARRAACDEPCRVAHSLRAAARAADHRQIEQVAAALEASLVDGRDRAKPPTAAWFDRVYRAIDLLGVLQRSVLEGGEPPDQWAEALAELGAAASGAPPVEPAERVDRVTPDVTVAPGPREPAAIRPAVENVRIAVDKLDALFAQAGELGVAHSRVNQRDLDLRSLRRDGDAWRREWSNARGLRASVRRDWTLSGATSRAGRELGVLLQLMDRTDQQVLALLQRLEQQSVQLGLDTLQLGVVKRAIQGDVMAVRVQPLATLATPLERALRDLTRTTGKEARLVFDGGDTELDRKILDLLRDPLMHMLRNAIDHGVELPEARVALGKPRQGTVQLTATQRGGMVEIDMADDGAGLDVARLRASAVSKRLLTESEASARDDAAVLELIFQPGFSTRTAVTDLSGRGVGMDVVRQHVERLNGQVSVSSTLGRGTRFNLTMPLTLATTRAVLVQDGGQLFAIPSAAIERSGRVRAQDLYILEGQRAVAVDGRAVAVVELASILERLTEQDQLQPTTWRWFFVLAQAERRVAIMTDGQLGEQEIVAKSLGWPLRRIRNVGGAAILGSGETVVILNPADLLKSGLKNVAAGVRSAPTKPDARRCPRRVLVVDDSLTTRSLVRSILEAAGYSVAVAVDGMDALAVVRREPIDLVVTDVDMPRMDGFEMTTQIRRDYRLRQMPVILVTSFDAPKDRDRGVAVGADAYIVKSGFDQDQLLATIGRLL